MEKIEYQLVKDENGRYNLFLSSDLTVEQKYACFEIVRKLIQQTMLISQNSQSIPPKDIEDLKITEEILYEFSKTLEIHMLNSDKLLGGINDMLNN